MRTFKINGERFDVMYDNVIASYELFHNGGCCTSCEGMYEVYDIVKEIMQDNGKKFELSYDEFIDTIESNR